MRERKKLNLFDATMLVMGGIVGVGIFFNPQKVAQLVDSPGPYFVLWGLGGLAALSGAMTFAELSGTFPRAGGWYVFLREAFGSFPAFLFAWIVLFVVSTGAAAVIAGASGEWIAELVWPKGDAATAPAAVSKTFGALILVGVTAVALTGVKSGAVLQNVCMVLKLAAIATFVLAGFAFFDGESAAPIVMLAEAPAPPPALARGMLQATLPVLFSYGGWQLVCYIAPNVKDPHRTLPISILLGVTCVVVVYLATNAAYVRVIGMEGLRGADGFAVQVARRALGDFGETFLIAAMAISSLGICTAILVATPGLYIAMSREGLFPEVVGREHPRTGAPVVALLVQGAIALAYFFWREATELADTVVFAEWIFHCLCGLALLHVRRTRPDLPRPFRSWAYPLFPITYAALAAAVVIGNLFATEGDVTRTGLTVLAVGAVVYVPWKRLADRDHG